MFIEAVAKAEGFDASEERNQKSEQWQQTTAWRGSVQAAFSGMLKRDITIKKAVGDYKQLNK